MRGVLVKALTVYRLSLLNNGEAENTNTREEKVMEWERLLSVERIVAKESMPNEFDKYPINELEKDYQAIISSSAFRRLQDKTQVFPLDKSDFVRTRLTHSIEVSTIAKQLGKMATQNKSEYLPEEFKENAKIVEEIPMILSCAGLLHDLGNPPFGHFGEVVIGEWFREKLTDNNFTFKGEKIGDKLTPQMKADLMNFEGNAQALRIVTKTVKNSEGYGINLSYSVLNSLIKYPTNSIEFNSTASDCKSHKLGYFYAEKSVFEEICDKTGTKNGDFFSRHPLAFLMEAADDIAYTTADLEDAMKKDLFSLTDFILYFEGKIKEYDKKGVYVVYTEDLLDNLKKRIDTQKESKESDFVVFQKWMEVVRQWLMYVVAYSFSRHYKDILAGDYKRDLFAETFHEYTIKILKGAMKKFVFNNNEILKLELAAQKIIGSLLDDFIPAVLYFGVEDQDYKLTKADKKLLHILSENYKDDYNHSKGKDEAENLYLRFLMVTDYISGMTDSFAKNLYQDINGLS